MDHQGHGLTDHDRLARGSMGLLLHGSMDRSHRAVLEVEAVAVVAVHRQVTSAPPLDTQTTLVHHLATLTSLDHKDDGSMDPILHLEVAAVAAGVGREIAIGVLDLTRETINATAMIRREMRRNETNEAAVQVPHDLLADSVAEAVVGVVAHRRLESREVIAIVDAAAPALARDAMKDIAQLEVRVEDATVNETVNETVSVTAIAIANDPEVRLDGVTVSAARTVRQQMRRWRRRVKVTRSRRVVDRRGRALLRRNPRSNQRRRMSKLKR